MLTALSSIAFLISIFWAAIYILSHGGQSKKRGSENGEKHDVLSD